MKTVEDLDVKGERILTRVDFNVPLISGKVTNDKRIKSALPTINYLLKNRAKVILMSHLGRPKGRVQDSLRMDPVAERLASLLDQSVLKLDDCVGKEVRNRLKQLGEGDVALLENTRFHPEEEENDQDFAKKLAKLADLFVNDAFGTAHRLHASTYGVAKYLPSAAGFLIKKEIEMLKRAVKNPERPFIGIIGGAKVKSKIGALSDLLDKVNTFLIGGGISYTFLKAKGYSVGESIVDENMLGEIKSFTQKAYDEGADVFLPKDVKVGTDDSENVAIVDVQKIPDGWGGYDIGPATTKEFKKRLKDAKTILWAGPLGMYENPEFAEGTREIAKNLAELNAFRIIGGGETAAAIEQFGLAQKMDHVSTGGGACLEFLRGKKLPVLEILEKQ